MYVKPHVCCDYPTMNKDSYYFTAFLLTGLFLDTFEGSYSRENGTSATSMNAFEDIKKENVTSLKGKSYHF